MTQNQTSMDPEFQVLRIKMQERICKWFERKLPSNQSSKQKQLWQQRLPDIAKKVEESIFKESINKEDYIRKFQTGIEERTTYILIQLKQNHLRQQLLHQQQQLQNLEQAMAHHSLQSNSSTSGMIIPTPGISQNSIGTMQMSSAMENNQGINPTSGPAGTSTSVLPSSHSSCKKQDASTIE